MILKSLLIFSFLVILVVVSGCSRSTGGTLQETVVSNFGLSLDASFIPVNSALIENKQIIDKVLGSRKKRNKDGFDTSLIFSESNIDPQLQTEQFVILNQKKFSSQLPGFSSGVKELYLLPCNESSIKSLWIEFSVKNGLLDDHQTFYFGQLQYVHNNKGYILSYMSNFSADISAMKKNMTSISCS